MLPFEVDLFCIRKQTNNNKLFISYLKKEQEMAQAKVVTQAELDAFREKYGADMPDLVQSPLDKVIGGKELPVGKGLDIGAKIATFLMASGANANPIAGAMALGRTNKNGTGWENVAGSKTESPEEVKKRQALALIAFKKNQQDTIYDASVDYLNDKTPLIIIAGVEYGSGSSRDWAAKGTALLGVRAVIAESFERIHRSNLIGMGVLPLQFLDGQNAASIGLDGSEVFAITGVEELNNGSTPKEVSVTAGDKSFKAKLRIDTPGEADYYRHGGIMQYVLRSLLSK